MREGELLMWLPAPSMLVTRIDGTLTEVGAESIVLEMLRVLSTDRRLLMMHDWEAMLGVAPSVGARLADAAWKAGEALEAAHFLLPARSGVFSLQGASALLRRLTVHPMRASFERRVQEEALSRRVRLPSGVRVVASVAVDAGTDATDGHERAGEARTGTS